MKEKSVKLNMFLNLVRTLMGVIYPLITFPYASRVLNPEGIGKVDFTNSTVHLFFLIGGMGIGTYAMREGAKIRDDKEKFNSFISEVFFINFFSTIVAYLIFIITIFSIPKYESYHFLLLFSSITIISGLLSFDYVYTATEDYFFITIRSILFQILAVIAMLIFVKNESDYTKYLIIGVLSNAGAHFTNFLFVFKKIRFKFPDLKRIKTHMRPILILFGATIASSVYQILDQNMLGLLSNDYEVGIYNAAIKVIHLSIPLLASLTAVLIPRLSYYAEQDEEKYFTLLKKSINLMLFIAIPSSVGIYIMSDPIIKIVCGEKFLNSIPVMKLMSPIVFFILCGNLFSDNIFIVLRKDKLNLYPVIIGAISNIFFNILFIPKYGAIGAAIGTIIAESCVFFLRLILAFPFLRKKHYFNELWKYIFSSIIMFIFLSFFNNFIHKPILLLFEGIFSGILIYSLMLILLKSEIITFIITSISSRVFRKNGKNE